MKTGSNIYMKGGTQAFCIPIFAMPLKYMSKRSRNVIIGALILAANSFVLRFIGFGFRIYLSNAIGSQGMGLYQLVLTLYMLIVMLGTAGISVAVSRLIAEQIALNHSGDAKRTLLISIKISLLISCAAGIILFFISPVLSESVLKDPRTLLSLKLLAPSIPFIAVTACYRGYFFAVNNTLIPSISQLVEQLVKMAVIIGVMGIFMPMGLEYACAGIILGMTAGEIVSFIVIYLMYLYNKKKYLFKKEICENNHTRRILAISMPVALSGTLTSGLRLVENILILSGLKRFGASEASATSMYGALKGMALPLLLFPSAVLTSVATTLIPDISASTAKGHSKSVTRAVSIVLKFTILLSVPVTGIFLAFSEELGIAIYNDVQVGKMLMALAVICPLIYLEMVISGILHALNQQFSSLIYNVSDSFMRIGLIYILVPLHGMKGLIVIIFISNVFTSLLKLFRLLKITSVTFNLSNWLLKPSLAVAAATVSVKLLCEKWIFSMFPLWLGLIFGTTIILLVYFALIFSLGCIKKSEITRIKRGLIKTGS